MIIIISMVKLLGMFKKEVVTKFRPHPKGRSQGVKVAKFLNKKN